jgi:hypothetical protein
MMKALGILFLSLMTALANAGVKPRGQGLPLPWPFPWAKECPVNWAEREGRYVLAADSFDERVNIGMTIFSDRITIARYSSTGRLLSVGLTFISSDEKVIEFNLRPRQEGQETLHAVLELHYSDWNLVCSPDKLVPILTLTKVNNPNKPIAYYRLVRTPNGNR